MEEDVIEKSVYLINDIEMEASEVAGAISEEQGVRAPCRYADTTVMYQHCIRKTFHFGSCREGDRTACGKQLFPHIHKVEDAPTFPWPQCGTCFGS